MVTVPSGAGRAGVHPLQRIVGGLVGATSDRYRDVLEAAREVPGDRVIRPERYRVSSELDDTDVLLVDDTWTTGPTSNRRRQPCVRPASAESAP